MEIFLWARIQLSINKGLSYTGVQYRLKAVRALMATNHASRIRE